MGRRRSPSCTAARAPALHFGGQLPRVVGVDLLVDLGVGVDVDLDRNGDVDVDWDEVL